MEQTKLQCCTLEIENEAGAADILFSHGAFGSWHKSVTLRNDLIISFVVPYVFELILWPLCP